MRLRAALSVCGVFSIARNLCISHRYFYTLYARMPISSLRDSR